ncbi:hypothetical protein V8G54_016386 [Vigna mungo]|uniref:Uncharacterized protein n=1 Tax=Vigna mungo TaxID=3915 RepID=A0AAQ3NN08_VIGMU
MSEPNIHTMVIRGMTIDSNYLVDADENGMIYGITQHHGLQHHSRHSNNFIQGNYLVWYPNLPISYVQASSPSANEFPSYMLMDTDDMSYETLYHGREFPSLGDAHSDMRLDIDDMSYEASIYYICIV